MARAHCGGASVSRHHAVHAVNVKVVLHITIQVRVQVALEVGERHVEPRLDELGAAGTALEVREVQRAAVAHLHGARAVLRDEAEAGGSTRLRCEEEFQHSIQTSCARGRISSGRTSLGLRDCAGDAKSGRARARCVGAMHVRGGAARAVCACCLRTHKGQSTDCGCRVQVLEPGCAPAQQAARACSESHARSVEHCWVRTRGGHITVQLTAQQTHRVHACTSNLG